MKSFGTLILAVLLCTVVTTRAGEKTQRTLDKDFIVKAAGINHEEMALGNLAYKHATSAAVKDYANMIVQDHKAAQDKLAALIKNRNIAIVTGLEQEAKDEYNRLSKFEGNQFDREFLQCMIKGHRKAIDLFETQANDGKETDIRTYAREELPTIRKHLSKAQELAKSGTK
jgi:putative membrane protein